MTHQIFKNLGYHKDFYLNGKYVGHHKLETYNGKCGYASKKNLIADTDIIIDKSLNKKFIIKQGQHYTTQIIPLCGRLIGTQKEKLNLLANSRLNF
tara:strand:- start:1853 stop:2140 length:288 start_codon:yes stop_codon:yes gene_type:complete